MDTLLIDLSKDDQELNSEMKKLNFEKKLFIRNKLIALLSEIDNDYNFGYVLKMVDFTDALKADLELDQNPMSDNEDFL